VGFLNSVWMAGGIAFGMGRWIVVVLVVMAVLVAKPSYGGGGLMVTSDALEMDQKKQVAVFSGNVVAEDGKMRLTSDKMTVNYVMKSQGTGGRGNVREVKADGNVSIYQGENHGMSQWAVYNVLNRTLELVGGEKNASINRGQDHLEGKRILLTLGSDLRIDRVSVQGGGKKRVSARISPSGRVEGEGSSATIPDLIGVGGSGSGREPPGKDVGDPVGGGSSQDRKSAPQMRPISRPNPVTGD